MITKEEFTELFETQIRGAAAAAFVYANKCPGEYWPMIRGEEEFTLRAIAEIGAITGTNLNLKFSEAITT